MKAMTELERLLTALTMASKVIRYYPPGHPQIEETLGRVLGQIAGLVSKGSALTLIVHDDGLYTGTARVLRFDAQEALFRNLKDLGVREVVLSPGVSQEELLHFVELLGRDPKKIWDEGGLLNGLRQRKVAHIMIGASDLAIAEKQAMLESLRAMPPHEREEIIAGARRWIMGSGAAPTDAEVVRLIAALREGIGFRGIIDEPGPEGYDKRSVGALVRLWGLVAKSGLEVPTVEAVIASEILATDPRTLLAVAEDDRTGTPSLQRLLERLNPGDAADLLADRVAAADTAGWIPVVDGLFRQPGTRRIILYRMLQRIRDRADAVDSVSALEDELSSGTREESAFLGLMRGACARVDSMPPSWSGRWGSGVLVRRATGVLERVGLGEDQRIEWLSRELDRLIGDHDTEGVLEVLEALRDRGSPKSGERETQTVVSRDAHQSLPPFLLSTSGAERIRTIKALSAVDRSWRELVGGLLDLARGEELAKLTGELEAVGIVPRDLILELMRSEKSEETARGIRIAGALAGPDDVSILVGFLQHGNTAIRMETVAALATVAPDELLRRLPALLKDPNPLVCMRALEVAAALPDSSATLVEAAKKGLLRVIPEETGMAVVEFVATHGTPEQKADFAASALSPRLIGKPVPSGVRDAVKGFLGNERPRGLRGLFTPRSHGEGEGG